MQEMPFQPLVWEDPLEEGMATHSSIIAWRIPGKDSLVGYSLQGCKDSDITGVTQHACTHKIIHDTSLKSQIFYNKYKEFWDNCLEKNKILFSNQIRSEFINKGIIMETMTVNEWLDKLEKTYK